MSCSIILLFILCPEFFAVLRTVVLLLVCTPAAVRSHRPGFWGSVLSAACLDRKVEDSFCLNYQKVYVRLT